MMRAKTRAMLCAILIAIVQPALARDSDGHLRTLITPNEGRPAVLMPGETFTVHATERRDLALRDGDRVIRLVAEWQSAPGGILAAECVIPEDAPQGVYAIAAGDDDFADVNVQSVFVVHEIPETYALAYVGSPALSASDPEKTDRLAAKLNENGPALVLLSGRLAATGGDWVETLRFIRAVESPVFVAPDDARDCDRFFGPATHTLPFGKDAYMSIPANAANEGQGPVYRQRRAIRSARWSVGIASAPPESWPMRTQIALLVDDPLDFVLIPGAEVAQGIVSWNTAVYITTPNGGIRLLNVEEIQPNPGEIIEP